MLDRELHNVLDRLKNVLWHETMFEDLQWYYAEEGLYVLRCKHGTPNEHLCFILANSRDDAISKAVLDLYKAERK